MNNKVLFGMYLPGNSLMHRLDPRLKLVGCFWFVILVFFARTWWTNLLLIGALGLVIWLSQVKFSKYWAGIRPLIWIILFTAVIQALFSSGGQVYWHWGWLAVTSAGVAQAGFLVLRFFLIITSSTVVTVTTTPLQLADALEALMKPLKYLRVPVSQLAMMVSIALRFVPTIMDEVGMIMNAQRARGMDFSSGSLFTRAKRLVPVMIPLFVAAFKRAEELAVAMEARGYDPNQARTKFRQLHWQRHDTWGTVVWGLLTVALVALRFVK